MKILQVRFHNLNSLAGTWSIDFTHPEYTGNGIFAILGPTGSGKTTILDALCLALYGRTPRLKQITKSTNEIMSRQTGECFAEIEFLTIKGRYRCHWSQHRARRQAKGELQPQKHEIVDCQTDRVLESRLKDVASKVVEVTGMTYDQFTRSILLAQGDFNRFLQATSDERAPILEQITGTEIYSRISRKVHELRSESLERLTRISHEMAGHVPLTPEQLAETGELLTENTTAAQGVEQALEQSRQLLGWHTALATLKQETTQLQIREAGISEQLKLAEPDRQRLILANKALGLKAEHSRQLDLQNIQQQDIKALANSTAQLQDLRQKHEAAEKSTTGALAALNSQKGSQREHEKLIKDVRRLDQEINHIGNRRDTLQKELVAENSQIQALDARLRDLQARLAENEGQLAKEISYQHQHHIDAGLVEDFSGIWEQLTAHIREAEKCTTLGHDLQDIRKKSDLHQQQISTEKNRFLELQEQHQKVKKHHTEMGDSYNRLLAGTNLKSIYAEANTLQEKLFSLENMYEHLRKSQQLQDQLQSLEQQAKAFDTILLNLHQQLLLATTEVSHRQDRVDKQAQILALAVRIQDYEEERRRLPDGSPCPLCGSVDHPYTAATPAPPGPEQLALGREQQLLEKARHSQSLLQTKIAQNEAQQEQAAKAIRDKHLELDERDTAFAVLGQRADLVWDEATAEKIMSHRQKITAAMNILRQKTEKLEALHTGREDLGVQLETLGETVTRARQQLDNSLRDQEQLVHSHDRLKEERQHLAEQLAHRKSILEARINPYTHLELRSDNAEDIIQLLAARRNRWQESESRRNRLSLAMQEMAAEREKHQAIRERHILTCSEKQKQKAELKQKLDILQQDRKRLYGHKNPDTEEQRLQEVTQQAEALWTTSQQTLNTLAQEEAACRERVETFQQNIHSRTEKIQQYQTHFSAALQNLNFTDEADFRNALLPQTEHEALAAALQNLEKQYHSVSTMLQERTMAYISETEKNLTTESPDVLRIRQENQRAALALLQQEIGALKQKLAEHERQQLQYAQKMKQLTAAKAEHDRWSRLHELIGSADGKKFRNFAQGLTFEMMVVHANRTLQKMSDRYLLIRDVSQPLELNVIDNYQAGETRSTKNLSGGESFIVSLALALGLSNMASQNVQVDSLFLDEGFGTLDEDSLQTALDTLSSLQQEGKIIGIISHIPQLQERVCTQIQVTSGLSGRSHISGPGVEH